MSWISTTSGKRFEALDSESMLDAALRQGVALSYSCRTGRCSSCKGRLQAGDTVTAHEELGLSQRERDEGWILTCVRRATSDVTIQVEDLGDVVLPAAKILPCRIQSLERLAPDVLKVVLRTPPTSPFTFLPGQYVDVIAAHGVRRSYSIANAPRADKQLELHVREVPGGAMSRYWFGQAKPADLLRLNGPLGTFFLRDLGGKDLVFLATGTGIAPVKSMLEALPDLCQEDQPRSVSVYWGGRAPEDMYWRPESPASTFRFEQVLSRAGPDWQGARGHVQDAFVADMPDLQRTVVYACGSDTMIHSARSRLLELGLSDNAFHSDAFVCSASP